MAGFFDRFVDEINKGINSVSESSKQFIEKTNINTRIRETEREMSQLYCNLGNLVYNLYKSGQVNISQCTEMYNVIKSCEDRLEDLRIQLVRIEEMKVQAYVNNTPVNAPSSQPVSQKQCACGFANKPNAKFCAKCGNSL